MDIQSLDLESPIKTRWYKKLVPYRVRGFFTSIYNFWYFGKAVWQWRSWDYRFTTEILGQALIRMADDIEKYGIEIREDRMPKVQDMRTVASILLEQNIFEHEDELSNLMKKQKMNFVPCEDSDNYRLEFSGLTEEEDSRLIQVLHQKYDWQNNEFIRAFDICGKNMQGWWD
jgi:hypothetical protein